jgi:hypothetical protein
MVTVTSYCVKNLIRNGKIYYRDEILPNSQKGADSKIDIIIHNKIAREIMLDGIDNISVYYLCNLIFKIKKYGLKR